jgi:hypothetical protein
MISRMSLAFESLDQLALSRTSVASCPPSHVAGHDCFWATAATFDCR